MTGKLSIVEFTDDKLREILPRILYQSGATDEQLSDMVGISRRTLNNWYNNYPEFKAAIVSARDRHNSEVLEKSLIKRAQGYDVVEHEQGQRGTQTIEIAKTKHIPPDTAALQFFLKLRSPERWKDKEDDKRSELAEVFAMIINKTRSLPATRTPEPKELAPIDSSTRHSTPHHSSQ